MDPVILDQINFDPAPEKLIKKMRLKPGSGQEKLLLELLGEGIKVARPRAIVSIAGIDEHLKDGVVLEGIRIESKVMAVNLSEVHRVFPYIVTAGRELYDWTQSKDDLLDKYFADQISQNALHIAEEFLLSHLKETFQMGRTSSLNPGSLKDWPITGQVALFRLLGNPLQTIGVELMASMLMIPNQTVSGIRYGSESDFSSCELCPREKCSHRRARYDETLLREKYT